MKRVFHHPSEAATGKRYWRSLGELSDTPEFREWLEREFPAGVAELNGAEWSRRRFFEVDGRLDGAGRIWFKWLPAAGSPSGSIHEECGVDDSRKISVLRDRDASAHRRDSAYRDDCGRTPDQARRQSTASGKWRRDRHFRPGVDS